MIVFIVLILSFSLHAGELPDNFLFGVSNAATQVEDNFDGVWMKFAEAGKVRAFKNVSKPHDRLQFWTHPEVEIQLAKELGVNVFRLSVEWERIEPKKGKYDQGALHHYKHILNILKRNNIKVMLTLFHHSLPKWAEVEGGWTNPSLIETFNSFSQKVFLELNESVDYWNTFNEPNVFSMFTYVVGIWPPGISNKMAIISLPFYEGDFYKALKNMAKAHNEVYSWMKQRDSSSQIGIAHNTANYKGVNFVGNFAAKWSWRNMNYLFPDLVSKHMDFMGINYYGSEYLGTAGLIFSEETEYNDAGRAIDPNGLYLMLKKFHERYNLPLIITENGTADEGDFFRKAYIAEHFLAIQKAIREKIPVLGYIHWSLTDNFEWSDGYCPKFGLVAVDREKGLAREKRPSFFFFQKIISQKGISLLSRERAWNQYRSHWGKNRGMCRAKDAKRSLDIPRILKLKEVDWRFSL